MPILHERIGEVGTVSWVHTALYKEEFRELEEWFSDAKSVSLRSSKNFQFFPVVSIDPSASSRLVTKNSRAYLGNFTAVKLTRSSRGYGNLTVYRQITTTVTAVKLPPE